MQDINLAVCGHANHGKSTLLGKAVAEFGMVTRKQIEEARETARKARDPSYAFANLVFRSKTAKGASEAARGITYQTALIRFEFDKLRVIAIDTPGQEDYTNNLFLGMFQADGALLLVSANTGIGATTLKIMRILVGFKIPLLGVGITKMDVVDYSQERYEEVKLAVQEKIREFGLDKESPQDIVYFPTAAYHTGMDIDDPGEGVHDYFQIDWHEGPSFKGFMENLKLDKTRPQHPLRAVIHPSEAYDHVPGIGKAVTALVESGTMNEKCELVFEPCSRILRETVRAEAKSIELTKGHIATPGVPVKSAYPRQLVGVALGRLVPKEKSLRDLFMYGTVVGTPENPPSTAVEMIIQFTIFDPSVKVRVGEVWTMHAHLDRVPITIDEIREYRIKDTDEWLKEKYEVVEAGDWARVKVTAHRALAIDSGEQCAPLSRLVIRHGQQPVAFGHCYKILN